MVFAPTQAIRTRVVNKKRTDLDQLLHDAVLAALSRHLLSSHLLQSPRTYQGASLRPPPIGL